MSSGCSSEHMLLTPGDIFISTFQTLTIRLARLTVNSFLENIDLVVRTLCEFGDDAAQDGPSHVVEPTEATVGAV